jgi:hypothetical protein
MMPTALPLALALFFQPADPNEQYALIRIQPVGIHESAEVARRRLAGLAQRPDRSIRVALQSAEVAPLLLGQPALALWVADNLLADWPGEGEILRLRLRAQGPAGTVLLNALADAFVRWELEEERRELQWRQDAWRGAIAGLRRDIEMMEKTLRNLPHSGLPPEQQEQERRALLGGIDYRRTAMHEFEGRIGRVERAVEFGWPQATVFQCKP